MEKIMETVEKYTLRKITGKRIEDIRKQCETQPTGK
jgi:hypothetical protein